MISRAFGWVAALAVAGLAFAATPGSAQAQCGYDHYAGVYNCYQPSCTGCGNRGLFTSGWVAPVVAPCGTCQQAYLPVQPCGACQQVYLPPQTAYPAIDDDDVPQYRVRVRRTSYVRGPVRHRAVYRGPVRHRAPLPGGGY